MRSNVDTFVFVGAVIELVNNANESYKKTNKNFSFSLAYLPKSEITRLTVKEWNGNTFVMAYECDIDDFDDEITINQKLRDYEKKVYEAVK